MKRYRIEVPPPAKPKKQRPKPYTDADLDSFLRLYAALRELDAVRRALEPARQKVARALIHRETTDRVLDEFSKFSARGGVTADDLKAWIEGRYARDPVKRKKHLRLVSSVEVTALKPVKQTMYEGPDTAA